MTKILATSDIRKDKECQKYAGKLHVPCREKGKQARWIFFVSTLIGLVQGDETCNAVDLRSDDQMVSLKSVIIMMFLMMLLTLASFLTGSCRLAPGFCSLAPGSCSLTRG